NELEEREDYIVKLLTNEEKHFNETIDRGINILNGYIDELVKADLKVLDGRKCFILSDTYGFPIDLTREILEEKGLEYDEEEFKNEMEIQRQTARNARGGSKYMGSDETIFHRLDKDYSTEFDGYDKFELETVIDFITTEDSIIDLAQKDDEIYIISKITPFYAESGGQVNDNGIIVTETGKCIVTDVRKVVAGKLAHKAVVAEGTISTGQVATFTVDKETRLATMRNHTTAHLLQSALREVLGDHVHQAGQLVDSKRLRFDFSHFAAVTDDELLRIEKIVNDKIMEAIPVSMVEMSIEEAQKLGAMALFGEKYGNVVRVVSIADYSIEFCGGTHVDNTSKVGLFKILSEYSVSAGVRRIEGVTGLGVLYMINDNINVMKNVASVIKSPNINEIVNRAALVMTDHKMLEKNFERLRDEISKIRVEALSDKAINVNGVNLVTAMFTPLKADSLRVMGDKIRDIAPNLIAVIVGVDGENGQFLVACGKEAVAKGAHAGKIAKEVSAITGGKGGGRPDSAMAGVGDKFKIDEALHAAKEIVAQFVK
ncbi:MAG: alanine--tRNA ligase, partial [Clostridiales bacterium]|nr:alanine--tRNA ligase [Clostridiales bacterium]